ncbi:MAG: TylF/MycF/NovP-related O-methyltransferase [Alphaproteobacteria bacterium]
MSWKHEARHLLRGLGFEIYRVAKEVSDQGLSYETVLPKAAYAPWRDDPAFLECYKKIERNTLVDIYRCWELWELIAQVSKLELGDVLEVGVWRGGTGALMAHSMELRGLKSQIYLCDTFTGVVKTGTADKYQDGAHSDTSAEHVEGLLAELGCSNGRLLKGIFPEATGQEIEDRKFRLCHIDVDVYQSARDVLHWVWPRLVRGGAVVFDDYGMHTTPGVTKLVNEEACAPDRMFLQNLNGHGILIKF